MDEMKLTPEQVEKITEVVGEEEVRLLREGRTKKALKERFFLWFFDAGRVGQTSHYLWLALRGSDTVPRRRYLRSAWTTVRRGPQY